MLKKNPDYSFLVLVWKTWMLSWIYLTFGDLTEAEVNFTLVNLWNTKWMLKMHSNVTEAIPIETVSEKKNPLVFARMNWVRTENSYLLPGYVLTLSFNSKDVCHSMFETATVWNTTHCGLRLHIRQEDYI